MMTKKKTTGPLTEAQDFARTIRIIAPNIRGIIFSNEGSKGREPLANVSRNSKNLIFAYWEDESKNYISISAEEPGYDVLAPKNMNGFFSDTTMDAQPIFLDVTHLDVSQTEDFSECFSFFGAFGPAEIVGLETWDVSKGKNFFRMFYYAFRSTQNVNLDLSNWRFTETDAFSMGSMFSSAGCKSSNIKLNVSNWNLKCCTSYRAMFQFFGAHSEEVELVGLNTWQPGDLTNMNDMFRNFALTNNYCIDLSSWSKNEGLQATHRGFNTGTFFQIKEPKWY